VWILCFDELVLALSRELAPRLRTVLNLKPPPLLTPGLSRKIAQFSALSADVRYLTPPFAGALRRRGIPLFTYTCNTPGTVRRSIEAGAFGIMSDRPAWLAGQLGPR
jgi:glycerophosphoryl diester phosphodiesterase